MNITENRWKNIENKLENISSRVARIRQQVGIKDSQSDGSSLDNAIFQDFVIQANPDYPPYSVQIFLQALSQVIPIHVSVHVHSSLKEDLDYELKDFLALESKATNRSLCKYGITVIWKSTGKDPILVVNPRRHIEGEVNIVRYFSRLIECMQSRFTSVQHLIKYDSLSPGKVALIDEQLDSIHRLIHADCPNQKKNLVEQVMKARGDTIEYSSIVDFALLSIYKQDKRRTVKLPKDAQHCIKKAISTCASNNPFIPPHLLAV